jgi:plasmid stabilization system protein ParE
MPVIKRFFADPEARGKITAYYDRKNSVDSVVRTVNFLEKSNDPTIAQYTEKNAMLYAAKDFINDLNKQMQDLQDQANMVRSADIPPDEKREILLEITKAQNLLVNDIRAIRKIIQP